MVLLSSNIYLKSKIKRIVSFKGRGTKMILTIIKINSPIIGKVRAMKRFFISA